MEAEENNGLYEVFGGAGTIVCTIISTGGIIVCWISSSTGRGINVVCWISNSTGTGIIISTCVSQA